MEGRLSADDLDHFRREIGRDGRGLSSYPHPRLMPDFWEYPTVSMGLGPIAALYHARFNRYLQNRQIDDTSQSRVWCFMGDGECDEPESLGRHLDGRPRAARQPDLRHQLQPAAPRRPGPRQRQDHPGAGGELPRRRVERHQGHLGLEVGRAAGQGQGRRAHQQDEHDGRRPVPALLRGVRRVHPRPLLRARPAAARDGRRPHRRRAAQPAPRRPRLPQALRRLQGGDREHRHRRPHGHPLQDDQGLDARPGLRGPQLHPPDQEDDQGPARRAARPAVPAGRDPGRRDRGRRPAVLHPGRGLRRVPVHDGAPRGPRRPDAQAHDAVPGGRSSCRPTSRSPSCAAAPATQEVSTTMGFTRLLRNLARDEHIGPRIVPIIPDEARTFGMDALFRELKIYAALGQKYEPVDHDLLLSYTESNQRPDPRGGHHRGRLDGQLHRRRHELRPPRRADGALLHVLFDVRLPARRRPHLAGRRRPHPRLPARRHGRAHDAARRGPAAPGRPQPAAGQHGARPCRPTTRRSPTRSPPSCRPGCTGCTGRTPPTTSATSSTTSPSTTRTT